MRYIGSKVSMLTFIDKIISKYFSSGTLCDPFGGIGTVSAYFKQNGYSIISGDILNFAHCFQTAKIAINNKQELNIVRLNNFNQYLNGISTQEGWFVQYYAIERKFFSLENAYKIQSCINAIWSWYDNELLSNSEYCLLIASLIDSMDKVANTAGTYYAYLKHFTRKAQRPFNFQLLSPIINDTIGEAYLSDALDLVSQCSCDILYLDPPYNERIYSHYYHLPETIATRIIPKPYGLSGIHKHNSIESKFTKKTLAREAFSKIIQASNCKLLVFHYSDNGLISNDVILSELQLIGEVNDVYCDAKGYTTNSVPAVSKHHIYWVLKS